MISKSLLIILAVLALAHSEVVVLDDSNYTSFVEEHPYVFVKFYAPWCGHCKSMAPDYEKLGAASVGKEYVIAEVDSTQSTNVSQQVGVEGYPTLKFIVNGFPLEYEGERDFESMQTWLEKTMSSEISKVTEEQVKELIGSADFVLIQGASSEQLKSLRFAKALGSTEFYAIDGEDFKITLHLKNSKTFEYTGDITIKNLAEWAIQNTLGSLVALTGNDIIRHVFENKQQLPSFLLLRNQDWSDALSDTLRQYCEQNKDKFVCAYADESHQIHKGISRFMKTTDNNSSILAYFDFGIKNGWKVPNPTEITKQTLTQFIEDVNAGNIEQFHGGDKGAENSKVEYKNVVQLTSETYNDTIKNNKFVFVEYYSPNCGHCVQFAPEYEKLATNLKESNSEYVIAAVDMTAQEDISSWVNINGYPTLKFFVNGHELEYSDDRSAEAIIEYMNKVTAFKLRTANSADNLSRPFVAIYGINEASALQYLPFKFTRYPVYWILGQSDFKVEVLSKNFAQYTGDNDLNAVANWLDQTTEEVIVNIVEEYPGKKLNRALENQIPLIAIINRDNSDAFKAAFAFLEEFCEGKLEFICGIANKDDKEYDSFNSWVNDPENEKTRLLYLDTKEFEKYLFEGDLATLNQEIITQFINHVKEGKIKAHQPEVHEFHQGEGEEAQAQEGTEAEAQTETVESTEEVVQETQETAQETVQEL